MISKEGCHAQWIICTVAVLNVNSSTQESELYCSGTELICDL